MLSVTAGQLSNSQLHIQGDRGAACWLVPGSLQELQPFVTMPDTAGES